MFLEIEHSKTIFRHYSDAMFNERFINFALIRLEGWAALIMFFVVLFLLGIVEGLQLALIELKRQDPDTYR